LIFHFCQSLWFRLLVDVKIEELEKSCRPSAESNTSSSEKIHCRK
jgi:hypothetical protein